MTTDRHEICRLLQRAVASDPVRNTVLGTILMILQRGDGDGWCAVSASWLAARSSPATRVVLTDGWEEPGPLVEALLSIDSLAGVGGPVAVADAVSGRLAARGTLHRRATRLFRLDELIEPAVAGTARIGSELDRKLFRRWYRDFAIDAEHSAEGTAEAADQALAAGHAWLWADPAGTPVSMAQRRPAVAGSARIGPVYTPPEHRGHGYGSAVTAAATADVLRDGAVPVLFTVLANPTSNKIYQQIGYRPVGDYADIDIR